MLKEQNVTTLKMEIFPASECEKPTLSSYTEYKEKYPLITAQISAVSQNTCIVNPCDADS